MRLSPLGKLNDLGDDDPETTFGTIARVLSDYRVAYLHIVNPALAALEKSEPPDAQSERMINLIRANYRGTLIVAGGFDQNTAEAWLERGKADLIAFGRKFIANPDLPERLRRGEPLNVADPATYYGGGPKGYTDYPSLAQEHGAEPKACVDERWR